MVIENHAMFSKMRQLRYRMTKCSAGSCYNICVGTTLVTENLLLLFFTSMSF